MSDGGYKEEDLRGGPRPGLIEKESCFSRSGWGSFRYFRLFQLAMVAPKYRKGYRDGSVLSFV